MQFPHLVGAMAWLVSSRETGKTAWFDTLNPFHGRVRLGFRDPVIWLLAALVAMAFLVGVLIWREKHTPKRLATFLAGDPVFGAFLFEKKACAHCHAINGAGGRLGPDLGTGRGSRSNMAQLVTTMWNHAPEMWKRMEKEGVTSAALRQDEVSHLFAFLYIARYMDEPGDTSLGQRLFTAKGCIQCHAIRGKGGSLGPDLSQISGVDTPITWTQTLWNHAPSMETRIAQVGLPWPRFEDNEMRDLLAYVREVSAAPRSEFKLLPANPARGWELFQTKACIACHAIHGQGGSVGPDLGAGREKPLSMVQFAGAMWNHSPQMFREMKARGIERPIFDGQEMADLMAFLNSLRYFEPTGSVEVGKGLFTARGCSRCHGANAEGTAEGPALRAAGRHTTSISLATALWRHGPEMYRRTQSMKLPWPKLQDQDLGDLFAFLNSPPREQRR